LIHTSQQVSGTITIELPSPILEISDEEALKNPDLMAKYDDYLVFNFFY
jgi:hypothetical protein